MATGSTKIGNSLAIKPQNTEPASAVECDIYNNLGELFIKRGDDFIPLGRSNEIPGNFAYSWGDCERSFNSETRSALTDTTSRTDSYWAYLSTGAAPSQETSSPLIGGASIKCVLDTSGEFLETRLFQVPTGYLGKPINFSFLMNTSTMTATTDYTVQIIRYDLNYEYKETISCVYNRFLGTGTLSGFFIAGNTGTDWYSLAISMNASRTSCEPIFDSFYFGVNQVSSGKTASDSGISATVGLSNWTTNVTHSAKYKRNENVMDLEIVSTFSGANTQGEPGILTVSGYTFDLTKFPTTSVSEKWVSLGKWQSLHAATNASFSGTVIGRYDSGNLAINLAYSTAATSASNFNTSFNLPYTISNGSTVSINISMPIVGWDSSITLLSNDNVKSLVRYTTNTAQEIAYPTRIDFEDLVFDTKSEVVVGASWAFTAKTPGYFRAKAALKMANFDYSGAYTGTVFDLRLVRTIVGSSATDYSGSTSVAPALANYSISVSHEDVVFLNAGDKIYFNCYDSSGQTINLNGSGTNNYIEIEQLTLKDSLMGLPISTQNIVGRTDGVAPATGQIGEYRESISSGATSLTSVTYSDGGNTGLLLPKGIWELQAYIIFNANAATVVNNLSIHIGTASGTSGTGLDLDRNVFQIQYPGSLGIGGYLQSPIWRVYADGVTTFYPKSYASFTTNTMTSKNNLFARRIA